METVKDADCREMSSVGLQTAITVKLLLHL